ncbi:MAG: N-formylglutamate amidohydrolase [Pseudomonadota bacterium]
MNHPTLSLVDPCVDVRNADATSSIILICEHASSYIPPEMNGLGLAAADMKSHVVWDPGAMALAVKLSEKLDAMLIASKISRLVYDCNRPPEAGDAIPAQSEVIAVPGNVGLSATDKAERVENCYRPFKAAVAEAISSREDPVVVTIHSFTPVYHGQPRDVEIGILHDQDTRLADALLSGLANLAPLVVRRNEPYGPADGVTHTLREHALPGGHLNVMLEIRSDLIADDAAQAAMADKLSNWLVRALAKLEVAVCKV